VVINAIQQISLIKGQGGHILICARPWQADGKDLIRIEVEDDGPGLHRELWERVFELGFTTRRKEGSGLGLYITRSLAEALGARVLVSESFILWGTTFVIELPAAASS
jgi:two-component system, NtrC family, sensor kinase